MQKTDLLREQSESKIKGQTLIFYCFKLVATVTQTISLFKVGKIIIQVFFFFIVFLMNWFTFKNIQDIF